MESSGYSRGEDASYTEFVSSHADVLARIVSSEKITRVSERYKAPVMRMGNKVLVEDHLFKMADICDILGKCGFVLRFIKEKSANDVEFHFSSV